MERRLGRGLGALLPESGRSRSPHELELDEIRPNPFQPRETFAPAGLEELRQSIVNHGILQPIVVRRVDTGYELISGERRWRAARLAGLRSIPAIVRPEVPDEEMLELALVENVQREDLDPIERARGFQNLLHQLSLTQEQVAEKVGLRRSTVANHLRLLDLPPPVQDAVKGGRLTMGHARALLGVQDRPRLLELAEAIVRDELTVRDIERRVKEGRTSTSEVPSAEPKATPTATHPEPWVADLERRMQDALGTRVSLRNQEGFRGQVVIDYFSREDLERVLHRIAPPESI